MRIGGWLTFPLAAITLAVAVGCGSVEARSSEAPAQDASTSLSSTGTLGSTDTTDAAPTDIGDASDPVPAVKEMSVFSQPRTEADVLPSELSYRVKGHGNCPYAHRPARCPGDPLPEESRLLLSGLGVRSTSLYAWPTTNGWVCWAWAEGAGGCVPDFADVETRVHFMGIDPDDVGIGYPGTLVGVVPDDVTAAEVQVRGVTQAAIVESNGIF